MNDKTHAWFSGVRSIVPQTFLERPECESVSNLSDFFWKNELHHQALFIKIVNAAGKCNKGGTR